MFDGIKLFLSTLISAVPKLYEFYKKEQQEDKILELLECYYLLRDIIGTAEELIEIVRDKKEVVFFELTEDELRKNYGIVQAKLTIQFQRLQRLGDLFLSNPTIELLDTEIKANLNKAIGGKEEGLYNIGAGLFFNQMFGASGKEGEDEKERLLRAVNEKIEFANDIISADRISVSEQRIIFENLKELQKQYLNCLNNVVGPEHKLFLASKAEDLANKYGVRP